MKRLTKNVHLLTPVASALFLATSSQCLASFDDNDSNVWQAAQLWEKFSYSAVGNQNVPMRYNTVLLALGRSVYADLLRARQAAINKESTNLRVSLEEAQQTIQRLELPPQLMALVAQLRVIQNDLHDTGKPLDAGLWVPVEAEIDDVLVLAPDEARAAVKEAIHKGRKAANQNDRDTAGTQLDIVTSSLEYSLGMFPLYKVQRDLDAALAAASLPQPDWAGTVEAVQSALATFHWYTHRPDQALLTAYNDVIEAYVLASGPAIRSNQKQEVLDYLVKGLRKLKSISTGKPLVEKAQHLLDEVAPLPTEIRILLHAIQTQIQQERQAAEDDYWETVSRKSPG